MNADHAKEKPAPQFGCVNTQHSILRFVIATTIISEEYIQKKKQKCSARSLELIQYEMMNKQRPNTPNRIDFTFYDLLVLSEIP